MDSLLRLSTPEANTIAVQFTGSTSKSTIPMSKKRRQHNPEFKARVGLEALKGIEPIHAIAAKYQVHPTQVTQWKKELLEGLPEVFARKAPASVAEAAEREAKLYQKIGQLEVELDWLKKKSAELNG